MTPAQLTLATPPVIFPQRSNFRFQCPSWWANPRHFLRIRSKCPSRHAHQTYPEFGEAFPRG
jgi:hypothetical protein